MNDQAIRFRFGIFVLGSLILAGVLTILFGGFPNYFKRTEPYTIIFATAQGVSAGTPVKRSGVRIGEVHGIALDNVTGKVSVEIRVDEKFPVRKGDRPTLLQGLLGGDSSIAFVPPEDAKLDDPTPVPPGSILQGVTPPDANVMMQKGADLGQTAQEALIEIRRVFARMDKMAPTVDETLKDFREIAKMTRTLGPELQRTAEEIRELAKTTRETIPDFKKTSDEMQKAVGTWNKVGEQTNMLLKTNEKKINSSLDQLDISLKRINEALSDENQKNLREILKNVRDGSVQLESIAKESSELIKDGRGTVKQLNITLKKADAALDDLQKTMKPFGERGPTVFKNFEESSTTLNATLKDLREMFQVVARSDGTVQKLLTDPALYNNLNDSAIMATRILPRLDRVLHDVEIFADKLARHPELIGIGGVVRPSSGLKEPPTTMPYRIWPRH